ncbi:MAG TPA: allantoicase [Actinoplanes sp.]|nr:allantoicase [Actinoplanes sp.]
MDFTDLPDLAVRTLGGSVPAANDELFAERENLIKPQPAVFNAHTFGHKGQIYDGWETRRRREPGHDWAVVRLGVPAVIRGVVVDTAFFTGNYPEYCSVEAASAEGYPDVEELTWTEIVPRSPLKGDTRNPFAVASEESFTHVRLNIHPDGGVARLRVHGEAVPDPRFLAGAPIDLAALANGGLITDASNRFYSSPNNLLLPGNARVMGDGWETARRRDDANDWVEVRLAAPGTVRLLELDTTHFKGNAPGWFRLSSGDIELIPRTRLQPDTRHLFRVRSADAVDRVRVDVYPDGGFARLRVWGQLTAVGREQLGLRWYNRLPAAHLAQILAGETGMSDVDAAVAARPVRTAADLPAAARSLVLGE